MGFESNDYIMEVRITPPGSGLGLYTSRPISHRLFDLRPLPRAREFIASDAAIAMEKKMDRDRFARSLSRIIADEMVPMLLAALEQQDDDHGYKKEPVEDLF